MPNAISVFFNPAAGDAMVEAAIRDILHKLERKAELHSADAISDEVTMHRQRTELWAKSSRLALMVSKVSSEAASTHHGRIHATAAAVDKTMHSAAHLADEAGHSAAHAVHEGLTLRLQLAARFVLLVPVMPPGKAILDWVLPRQ